MDLISPKKVKQILESHGVKPNKVLGQNFLIDKNILNKIVATANLKSSDIVLEVGPGVGTLTQELAKTAKKVIAVEKDKKMCEILKETLADFNNVEIIQADALSVIPGLTRNLEHVGKPLDSRFRGNDKKKGGNDKRGYKLVANIPYYLTSPLIRKFLEEKNQPQEIVLLVQKEVAQRICAKPLRRRQGYGGQARMSLLAVSVQFYAEPKIISYVSKNCFLPAPKVDSAIIKLTPHSKGRPTSHQLFFKIVKAGFSHPRKQLLGNLTKGLKLNKKTAQEWLTSCGIKPTQRAETLNVEDWKNLTKKAKNFPKN